MASRFDAKRDRLAVDADRARVGPVHAEQRQRELGAARAEQPREAEDLARVELEAHVLVFAGLGQALDLEDRSVARDGSLRRGVGEALARHQHGEAPSVMPLAS